MIRLENCRDEIAEIFDPGPKNEKKNYYMRFFFAGYIIIIIIIIFPIYKMVGNSYTGTTYTVLRFHTAQGIKFKSLYKNRYSFSSSTSSSSYYLYYLLLLLLLLLLFILFILLHCKVIRKSPLRYMPGQN